MKRVLGFFADGFAAIVLTLLLLNADAHLKRTIMGREVVIAITNGKLDLGPWGPWGPWEAIFYGEFDGQRAKRVLIKIIGE